jgi:hypothetical protein
VKDVLLEEADLAPGEHEEQGQFPTPDVLDHRLEHRRQPRVRHDEARELVEDHQQGVPLPLRLAGHAQDRRDRGVPVGERLGAQEGVLPVREEPVRQPRELLGGRSLVGLEGDRGLARGELVEETGLAHPAPAPEKRQLEAHAPQVLQPLQLVLAVDEPRHVRTSVP